MTHASIPETERINWSYNSLIRLSVGIEDINDLIDDLRRTLIYNIKQISKFLATSKKTKV